MSAPARRWASRGPHRWDGASAPLLGGHRDGSPAGHGTPGNLHVADDLDGASGAAAPRRHADGRDDPDDPGTRASDPGSGAHGPDGDRTTTDGRGRAAATGDRAAGVAGTARVAAVAAVAARVPVTVAVTVVTAVDVGETAGVTTGDGVLPPGVG